MKKYKASTPDALVIGQALLPYNDSVERDSFAHILETYDLENIDPEAWYPQQLTLDIQRSIKNQPGGSNMLVSIGMKIIDNAQFPPMESLQDAVEAFAASYPMNFKNQADDDVIQAEFVGDNHIQVINGSPHSDEMIYGYIYSLIRRFAPQGTRPKVAFEDIHSIDSDADTVFNITW